MEQADIEALIRQTHDLAKENNRMLHAIRRDAWISFIGRVIFWILIIIVPTYLAYLYIQPYLSSFTGGSTQSASGTTATTSPMTGALQDLGFPPGTDLNGLIKQYQNLGN
ncbi:MAG: hypothetical protein KGI41_01035 [Patescibacteria group bacterium]|nr:hypothetical protein [Patescibacteria group bacterium]